jgi:lysocardiolipin and lysophospholipid acyltransferase
MPLPPLENPKVPAKRFAALAKGVGNTTLLFSSLMVVNTAQALSTVVRPFSRRACRDANRWLYDRWGGLCVTVSTKVNGARLIVTGDEIPRDENVILMANHQQMADVPFLWNYAGTKGRVGDMKWIVKDALKYAPGLGVGMAFLEMVFVKRNWTEDREYIRRLFATFHEDRIPLWLMTFPEGTRFTPDKQDRNRKRATETGIEPFRHLLVPRIKGFVAAVIGLRGYIDAVYDVTIGYEQGVPTLWQFVEGLPKVAHMHVRSFPMAALPEADEALAAWLIARYREKDELLEGFYRDGRFPGPSRD